MDCVTCQPNYICNLTCTSSQWTSLLKFPYWTSVCSETR